MGLLYPFPSSRQESEFFAETQLHSNGQSLLRRELKSYGLPYIFWGYLAAFLVVLVAMVALIHDPLAKLMLADDGLDRMLAWGTYASIFMVLFMSLALFFYQKFLRLDLYQDGRRTLTVTYRFFFLPVWKKSYLLASHDTLEVKHFMDSPNMARIHNQAELASHQNRGYFELILVRKGHKHVRLDRHSQRLELEKTRGLLLD